MLNIDDRLIKEVSPKIGANALSVLLAIAIHLNQKTNRAFPSHYRLMQLTGLGRDAIYTALSKLQKEGLLKSAQKIDSKNKTFGRREFKLDTRFIKIFVDAADMEPLPENPYTAHPYTAHPYTAHPETYQLNKSEQINNLEQINKRERENTHAQILSILKTDKTQIDEGSAAAAGNTFEGWIKALKDDYRIKEGFTLSKKIPAAFFDDYLTRFIALANTMPEKYSRRHDLTGHFLNWSGMEYRQAKETPTTGRTLKNIPTYG